MNVLIAAIGIVGLIGLSVSVGFGIARQQSDERAEQLRRHEWDLWLREHEMIGVAEMTGCPSCALLRARADLQSAPPT
jgi:hypothetical protein